MLPDHQVVFQASSISTQVYTTLKKQILEGTLQPGTRLLVLEIAGKFQVSQAPVREALERLKQEGLIVGKPNKGSVVSNITTKEIRDIFVLREIIEGFAIRESMPLLGEDDFRQLESICDEMEKAAKDKDLLALLELDMQFHGFLYVRCNNQAVLDLWHQMKTKVMRFMAISNRHYNIERLKDGHLRLIDALRSGNVAEAEAKFIQHMDAYKKIHVD